MKPPLITADSPAWAAFVGSMATDDIRETITRLSAEANNICGRLEGTPKALTAEVRQEQINTPTNLLLRGWQRRVDAIRYLKDELALREYMRNYTVGLATDDENNAAR